jgi:hypothetical protein
MVAIGSPREFYAGAIYIAFGAAGLWFGWAYPMGTAGRMGGGYFPKVLSVILIIFGLLALARGVRVSGPQLAAINFRPLLFISAACALFGLLLEPIGFIGSLFLLILMSAMASRAFRWNPKALAGAAGMVAICALVFVKGLSVPIPLLGSWLVSG